MKTSLRENGRAGVALIEVAVGSVLLVMFATGALMMANTTKRAYRTETKASHLDSLARKALDQIADVLSAADGKSGGANAANSPSTATAGAPKSIVDFDRITGFDDTTSTVQSEPYRILFEYDPGDPDDGVDNDGDGFVDEGRVVLIRNPDSADEVRAVLCNGVAESLEGETPGNLVDDNDNGLVDEPGLSFDVDPANSSWINVNLTLIGTDSVGNSLTHTVSRTIAMRNTPPPI